MRLTKIVIRMLTVTAALAVLPGTAGAAGERAVHDFMMTPHQGSFFKDLPKPANWRVFVEVKAPYPESPDILPMKEVLADFPDEMSFNPDPDMPVCGDGEIGPPPVNLNIPPDVAIERCPGSVLGNGTSHLYLFHQNSANGPNLDADLVLFNGGRTRAGLPILKMHGFSESVGAGVYMVGVLKDSILRVSIPYLPFDSAVGDFELQMPGTDHPVAGRHGKDPAYVRTTCAKGVWNGGAQFTLGTRDGSGLATGPESVIDGAPLAVPCEGQKGRGKLRIGIKGPKRARAGGKGTYRVSVRNAGTATVSGLNVGVRAAGVKAKRKAGQVPPGGTRQLKVKLAFQRKGVTKLVFKASGRGANTVSRAKAVTVR